ncbi:molybdate ABC transporter substrate-binding protein [Actinokineospora soli]
MKRALVLVALLLAGCSTAAAGKVVTVFAAASLTESFTALESAFERANPGVDVRLNFAASSALAQQIANGAAADVFASADERTMTKVTADSRVFATNRLTIAVPPGNPGRVRTLSDLPEVVTVVCAPQVPCGNATAKALAAAGVTLRPASEEQDVKAVLTKVVAGEADAGLVYVTDARSASGKVESIDFPESAAAVNRYPITVLPDAPSPDLAQRFVDLVLGPEGQAEFARLGFGKP